jgi:glycerophosphoryl diester phosphodiesterase
MWGWGAWIVVRLIVAVTLLLGLTMWSPADAAHHRSACEKVVKYTARCAEIEVYGHRGRHWRTATNENTLVAFKQDAQVGASFEADAWVLSDGTAVIFHDKRLGRVVDRDSMPPGVTARTTITSLTTAQFRQLRTKGGQPLMTLERLLKFSGRRSITGMIENKYTLLDPVQVSDWVTQFHAPVVFYQTPKCREGVAERPEFLDYGMTVGAKYIGACAPSPQVLAEAGFSFLITHEDAITPEYVADAHSHGLEVGNFNSGKTDVWTRLVAAGADYLLVPHPGKAEKWLK